MEVLIKLKTRYNFVNILLHEFPLKRFNAITTQKIDIGTTKTTSVTDLSLEFSSSCLEGFSVLGEVITLLGHEEEGVVLDLTTEDLWCGLCNH